MKRGFTLPAADNSYLVTRRSVSVEEPVQHNSDTVDGSFESSTQHSYSDDESEEYSDDFEEESDENESENNFEIPATSELCSYTDKDLGGGLILKVPKGASEIECFVQPLNAEERTKLLEEVPPLDNDIMVSDMYTVLYGEFPELDNGFPYKLQLPLDLPITKHDKRDLFRFIAHKRNRQIWNREDADYKGDSVRFNADNLQHFVIFASPSAEFAEVTPRGFTFVSSKDERIRVDIPDGALKRELTISVQIQPNSGRLDWYRAYDPSAFEGIYAFSDILSVRHACEETFQKKTTVELPVDTNVSEDFEIKALNIENGKYEIDEHIQQFTNGTVKMIHTVSGTNSCQASLVRPGVKPDDLKRCAMFQAKELNMCKILTFLSDSPRIKCRCLTIEVVEAPYALEKVKSRQEIGYFEIKQSRSSDIEVHKWDRIQISTCGNINLVGRMATCSFRFSPTSSENFVDLTIKPAGFMAGLRYGIVSIKVGEKDHEIHFCPDHIPMKETTNLNKKTINLDEICQEPNSELLSTPTGDQASKKPSEIICSRNEALHSSYDRSKPVRSKQDDDRSKPNIETETKTQNMANSTNGAYDVPREHKTTSKMYKQDLSEEHSRAQQSSSYLSNQDFSRDLSSSRDKSISGTSKTKSKTYKQDLSEEHSRAQQSSSYISDRDLSRGLTSSRVTSTSGISKTPETVTGSSHSDITTDRSSGYHTENICSSQFSDEGKQSRLESTIAKQEQYRHASALEDKDYAAGKANITARDKVPTNVKKNRGKSSSVQRGLAPVTDSFDRDKLKHQLKKPKKLLALRPSLTNAAPDTPQTENEMRFLNRQLSSLPLLSTRGSVPLNKPKVHPVLEQRSLQVLSQELTPQEWQQLMVELGMGSDNITMIIHRALKENWNPYFKLLLAWYNARAGEVTDEVLILRLEKAFKQINRRDIALKISSARTLKLPLRKDDFE